MLFNSQIFTIFFPIVFFLNYFIPKDNLRIIFLLFASLVFFSYDNPIYLLFLFYSILVDYILAIRIDSDGNIKHVIYSFLLNFIPLFLFKYYNFFLQLFLPYAPILQILPFLKLSLPLGISFYTFQTFSYTVDVYQKKIKAEKNLSKFSLFVTFFPQLIAGPIERAGDLLPQLVKKPKFNYELVRHGAILFFWGLFKKIVIADRFGYYGHRIFEEPFMYRPLDLFLSGHLLVFQFYCDFSGYSDMAVGMAKMLNIHLTFNFKSPFFAKSPIEFWRRWHITLMTWFTDYVFYPLVNNSTLLIKRLYAIVVIFLLSGIWHGADLKFILWGVFIGVCVALNHLKRSLFGKFRTKNILINFFFTVITFYHFYFLGILVNAMSVSHAQVVIERLFQLDHPPATLYNLSFIPKNEFIIMIIAFFILNLFDFFQQKTNVIEKVVSLPTLIRWPIYFAFCLFVFISAYQNDSNLAFLYFQF